MKRKYNISYKVNLSTFEKFIYNRYIKLIQNYNNNEECYKKEYLEIIMNFIDEERDILLGIPEFKQTVENFKLKILHDRCYQVHDEILPQFLHY